MELNGVKEDIDSRMKAELQPRKKLKREVQIWLENIERINGEVQNLNERISESSTLTRGFHVDDVLKMTREVEELIQQGKFQEDLVKCLMDDEVGKIGVWGMGGVGKTKHHETYKQSTLTREGEVRYCDLDHCIQGDEYC
ncbi:hypothetical protein GOBAR_DD34161 [Gossypium barbadense]|nr:hypothetical protein GOBAR_DD34161 [Gossypium barbadense]